MLHGDISNQRDYIIGIRVEDCLLQFNDKGIKNKLLNFINGRVYNADINPEILSIMRYIYEQTSYTLCLIIDEKNYNDGIVKYFDDMNIPYNQIGNVIKGISSVTMMLLTGELSYYIDTDEKRIQEVNSEYAITPKEFNSMLRRKINR